MFVNVCDAPWSVVPDGITDCQPVIQSVLDLVGGAGGGTVFMPSGSYLLGDTLAIPSNTTLLGEGWSTVLLNPTGMLPGKLLSGVTVFCTIAMVGVTNARVSSLTVDHFTNGSDTNGIQIGETLAETRSSDCVVESCQLLGINTHQYLIYVKCADRSLVIRNRVVGYSETPTTDTAGIEIYGAHGCKVLANEVSNCAPGIILAQEQETSDSDLLDVLVQANRVTSCNTGIIVLCADERSHHNSQVLGNVVSDSSNRGISLSIGDGDYSNIAISNNLVLRGGGLSLAVEGPAENGVETRNLVLQGNLIEGGTGVLIRDCDPIFKGNSLSDCTQSALTLIRAPARILDNQIERPAASGIDIYSTTGVEIERNVFRELNGSGIGAADAGSSTWRIYNNSFYRAASAPNVSIVNAATVANSSCIGNTFVNPPATARLWVLGGGSRSDASTTFNVTASTNDDLALPPGDMVWMNGATANYTITGIANGQDGQLITLLNNNGGGFTMTLAKLSSNSVATNRFYMPAALTIGDGSTATLRYSKVNGWWIPISTT